MGLFRGRVMERIDTLVRKRMKGDMSWSLRKA